MSKDEKEGISESGWTLEDEVLTKVTNMVLVDQYGITDYLAASSGNTAALTINPHLSMNSSLETL